jgi:hypothetical protein
MNVVKFILSSLLHKVALLTCSTCRGIKLLAVEAQLKMDIHLYKCQVGGPGGGGRVGKREREIGKARLSWLNLERPPCNSLPGKRETIGYDRIS